MADRSGQQIGNYRLVRLLGEGGFAEVYLGEHLYLETEAAIKFLRTQLTSDDIEQFRAEARIIARLEHPNIVRVLDFGVEGNTPFLVMSYAPNGTLRQYHKRGVPLSAFTIVSYIKQIADALQYAHNQKLIHRDIKPENRLIGRHNEIILSDFGIALVAQSSRYQHTRDVVGTVAYMAPEQIQGKPRPASDQYSLAVVVSASHGSSDGIFLRGPLTERTVDIKWYLKHEGILDLNYNAPPDYYLVLAGPKSTAGSSRGAIRPWTIESVFLFDAHQLLAALRQRGNKLGVATGVISEFWSGAEIYPLQRSHLLTLDDEQRQLLALFR